MNATTIIALDTGAEECVVCVKCVDDFHTRKIW